MRGYLHGKEWVWIGDILALTKDEELHRRVAEIIFNKICSCGERRKCVLSKIKAIATDFEISLWRAFRDELEKHH